MSKSARQALSVSSPSSAGIGLRSPAGGGGFTSSGGPRSIATASTVSSMELSGAANTNGRGGGAPASRRKGVEIPSLSKELWDNSFDDADSSSQGRGGTGLERGGRGAAATQLIIPLTYASAGGGAKQAAAPDAAAETDVLDPRPHLGPLGDERSSYASVRRSCLAVNQFAGGGHGGPNTAGGGPIAATDAGGADLCGMGASTPSGAFVVTSSCLTHDVDYGRSVSSSLRALASCASSHSDRRCRIAACGALAILARSAYARLRRTTSSSAQFGREGSGTAGRVEDECASDVPAALLAVAMDDDDDGVSASALEAVGTLVLDSSSPTSSAWNGGGFSEECADPLLDEIRSVSYPAPNPDCSRDLPAPPHADAASELRERILSAAIPPRVRRVLHRTTLYRSSSHAIRALPLLTEAAGHLLRQEAAATMRRGGGGGDGGRVGNAKRWGETDGTGLASQLVRAVILPLMTDGTSSGPGGGGTGGSTAAAAVAAAMAGLRLVHTVSLAGGAVAWSDWMPAVCRASVGSLSDALVGCGGGLSTPSSLKNNVGSGECSDARGRRFLVATLLVALRSLPACERSEGLAAALESIIQLPVSDSVPLSPMAPWGRPPAGRIGLWTEVVLLSLVPGAAGGGPGSEVDARLRLLRDVINSRWVGSALLDRGISELPAAQDATSGKKRLGVHGRRGGGGSDNGPDKTGGRVGPHPAEEIVFTFCSVACLVGRRLTSSGGAPFPDGADPHLALGSEMDCWLRCSLLLLSEFSSCLNWQKGDDHGSQSDDPSPSHARPLLPSDSAAEALCSLEVTSQLAYLRLLRLCLGASGFLSPESSVSFTMLALDGGDNESNDDNISSTTLDRASAALPATSRAFAVSEMLSLSDKIVEYKLKGRLPLQPVLTALLALLSDQWVRQCHVVMDLAEKNCSASGALSNGGPSPYPDMNDTNAKELLSILTSEISFLVEREKKKVASSLKTEAKDPPTPQDETDTSDIEVAHLLVYIACVENMALAANDWGHRFNGDGGDGDNSGYIVSVSIAALHGQTDQGKSAQYVMMRECLAAAARVQASVDGRAAAGGHMNRKTLRKYSHLLLHSISDGQPSPFRYGLRDSGTIGLVRQHVVAPYLQSSLSRRAGAKIPGNIGDTVVLESFEEGAIRFRGVAYDCAYATHVQRLAIELRTERAMESSDLPSPGCWAGWRGIRGGGRAHAAARRTDPLYLSSPPPSFRSVACRHQSHPVPWRPDAVFTVTGPSDPVVAVMSCGVERSPSRCDGGDDGQRDLVITLRLHNVTATPIPSGVRLNLRIGGGHITEEEWDGGDPSEENETTTGRIASALGVDDHLPMSGSLSTMIVTSSYGRELKPGDHITWAVRTSADCTVGTLELSQSVFFRDMETEIATSKRVRRRAKSQNVTVSLSNVAEDEQDGTSNDEDDGTDKKTDEDDFSAAQDGSGGSQGMFASVDDEEDEIRDIRFGGETVRLSPLILLRPCPLVFFRGRVGDRAAFRFLWSAVPFHVPTLRLCPTGDAGCGDESDGWADGLHLSMASTMLGLCWAAKLNSNPRVVGLDSGWAFAGRRGERLLCLLSVDNKGGGGFS